MWALLLVKTKFDQMQTYLIDFVFKFWDKATIFSGNMQNNQQQQKSPYSTATNEIDIV